MKTKIANNPALLDKALNECADSCRTHDREVLGEAAYELIKRERFADALRIFDVLIPFYDTPSTVCCNALWAVLKGNTGLPFDAFRARRYLATGLCRQNDRCHRQLVLAKENR